MSDAMAALWAALIGAFAALLVGGVAFVAALKQVTKTAYSQRQQAFWQLRRDTYANYLLALRGFSRAARTCSTHLMRGDADAQILESVKDAAEKFHDVAAVLDIESPGYATYIHPVSERCEEFAREVEYIVESWWEGVAASESGVPSMDDEFLEFHRILELNIDDIREAFRIDLHRGIRE
ncbi:hypothetical protein [Streptomyces sioyaensis]|uniref:hypothetical protein n=1 Tax=Streptomyces sioyaensis TaxID=67364 RepID=UPI0036ECFAAF